MNKLLLLLILMTSCLAGIGQDTDSVIIKRIFDNAITNREAYHNLQYLTTTAPGRLIGSENSIAAQKYMLSYFRSIGVDTAYLQEYQSKAWSCDTASVVVLGKRDHETALYTDALGNSPPTEEGGIVAGVIEVKGLDELEKLGAENIKGKIVFFNRPMKDTFVNTFQGYGEAVDQRSRGPSRAAIFGAAGAIVRSVTTSSDNHPHTGSTRFELLKIPAVAISTNDADFLSRTLAVNPKTRIRLLVIAHDIPAITTCNLIAEIRGKVNPGEVITVGGHIDSWFNSPGAHDDAIGCVMAADVFRIFREMKMENNRTIRAVLFMDEELYQSGGHTYADQVSGSGVKPYFALEADEGGFTPEGFTIDAPDSVVRNLVRFQPLLEPYGIQYIRKGGGGVDIYPLKKLGTPLAAYVTDPQRYFDLHHSPNDTFDKVNFREMQLGSTCLTALIYLIDRYGLE